MGLGMGSRVAYGLYLGAFGTTQPSPKVVIVGKIGIPLHVALNFSNNQLGNEQTALVWCMGPLLLLRFLTKNQNNQPSQQTSGTW